MRALTHQFLSVYKRAVRVEMMRRRVVVQGSPRLLPQRRRHPVQRDVHRVRSSEARDATDQVEEHEETRATSCCHFKGRACVDALQLAPARSLARSAAVDWTESHLNLLRAQSSFANDCSWLTDWLTADWLTRFVSGSARRTTVADVSPYVRSLPRALAVALLYPLPVVRRGRMYIL